MNAGNGSDNRFVRWVRSLLQWWRWRNSKYAPEPKVLEELLSDRAVLALLECDKPGVVDLWRLTHKDAHRNLLITLIYLAQLREDLAHYRRSDPSAPSFDAWRKQLSLQSHHPLEDPSQVDATHVVLMVWATRHPVRQVVRGKVRFVHRTELVACVFCNLEGNSRAWAPSNRYARKIVRSLMLWLAELRPPHPTWTWEETIRLTDLKVYLDRFAKNHLGKDHQLQPPKRPDLRF